MLVLKWLVICITLPEHLLSFQLINQFSWYEVGVLGSGKTVKCAGQGLLQDQSWEASVLDEYISCSQLDHMQWKL